MPIPPEPPRRKPLVLLFLIVAVALLIIVVAIYVTLERPAKGPQVRVTTNGQAGTPPQGLRSTPMQTRAAV